MEGDVQDRIGVLRRFWNFLKKDSWSSLIVTLILALIIILLVLMPLLRVITGSDLPLVIVESCSMNHPGIAGGSFDNYWKIHGSWYEQHNISKQEFENFKFPEGIKMGDIILVYNRGEINLGDTIIFQSNQPTPIIHRVVSLDPLNTKGDNNFEQLVAGQNSPISETNINQNQVLGKAIVKIPRLGWVKLIFVKVYELMKGTTSISQWC